MLFMKSLKVTKLHCIRHGQVISTTIQNFSKKKDPSVSRQPYSDGWPENHLMWLRTSLESYVIN